MNPDLQQRFETIEKQRQTILDRVSNLSEAQMSGKPETTAWNIRQIVEHLVLSDETVGHALDTDAVPSDALPFRLVPRPVHLALILRALNRDVVLPLPSPAAEPQGEVSLSALLVRWETERATMRDDLERLPADEPRYSHPILGSLTAIQMLDLSQSHIAYHTRQIEARQREAAFPGSGAL